MKRIFLLGAFLALVNCSVLRAASFPVNLTSLEVNRITQVIGLGSATRLLRSADPYEIFPGIKIGMEMALVPSNEINTLGNGGGSLPGINPTPRFYFAKGLFLDLDLVFSFMPA